MGTPIRSHVDKSGARAVVVRSGVPGRRLHVGVAALAAAAAAVCAGVPAAVAQGGQEGAAPPAAPVADAAASRPTVPANYKVRAGDVLEVVVLRMPEYSRPSVPVLPDGTISYPYLKQARVEGLTLPEITELLLSALRKELRSPQVVVTVVRRNIPMVGVLGDGIRTQGKREMGDGWRVLNLIMDAGGLATERAEWTKAKLIRDGGTEILPIDLVRVYATGDPQHNVLLQPGDVLMVEQVEEWRTRVQVLGEVARPGPVPIPENGSLVAALTAAGNPTPKAALARAIVRRVDGKTVDVDLSQIATSGKVPDVRLEPGDSLIIPKNERLYAVTGAVGRTGTVEYPENRTVTVLEAITEAGGPGSGADLKNALVARRDPQAGGIKSIPVDLEKLLRNSAKGGKPDPKVVDVPLEPGDVVYVPAKEVRQGRNFLDDLGRVLPFLFLF